MYLANPCCFWLCSRQKNKERLLFLLSWQGMDPKPTLECSGPQSWLCRVRAWLGSLAWQPGRGSSVPTSFLVWLYSLPFHVFAAASAAFCSTWKKEIESQIKCTFLHSLPFCKMSHSEGHGASRRKKELRADHSKPVWPCTWSINRSNPWSIRG